jgi:hypothetical protein
MIAAAFVQEGLRGHRLADLPHLGVPPSTDVAMSEEDVTWRS